MNNQTPIPDDEFNQFKTELSQMQIALAPYLISLNAQQIRELSKIGDHFKVFVERTLRFALENPNFFPPTTQAQEHLESLKLYDQADQLADILEALARGLRNMSYVAGADSKKPALEIYGLMETLRRSNPIIASEYDELKKFFPHDTGGGKNDK